MGKARGEEPRPKAEAHRPKAKGRQAQAPRLSRRSDRPTDSVIGFPCLALIFRLWPLAFGLRPMSHMRTVVVTGTSTGIGYATARVLTQEGIHVFGSVRRPAGRGSSERRAGSVVQASAVRRDRLCGRRGWRGAGLQTSERAEAVRTGQQCGRRVPGPLLHLPIDDFRRQLEVNLIAQLFITQAFAPLLGTDDTQNGFAGTHRDDVVNRRPERVALRWRLQRLEVRHGGNVRGPPARVADVRHRRRRHRAGRGRHADLGQGRHAGRRAARTHALRAGAEAGERLLRRQRPAGLPAETIGRTVLTALTTPRPRTRYTVTPEPMKWLIGRVLPKRLVDRLIAKRLGWSRPR